MTNDTWWVGEEQLDEAQKSIIALPLSDSHLIIGPPGSGKTNLLLLRANWMALSGLKNIMIIVFTRYLRDFIVSGGKNYSFPPHKVMTSVKWQRDLLYEYGEKVDLPEDFNEQRKYLADRINTLIIERNLVQIYDAIFLDEAQDYTPQEIEIFKKLGNVLYAVADSRQRIYSTEDPLSLLKDLTDQTHHLKYHYRNGLAICKLADAIAKDSSDYNKLEPTSNYDEKAKPSSVVTYKCENIDEQAAIIIEKLKVQLRAYPGELLCVICPKKNPIEQIWNLVVNSDICAGTMIDEDNREIEFESGSRIIFSTVHGIKGLEARAVHFAACDELNRSPHLRNIAYTAVTRAKTSLAIYYSKALPGFFEQALQTLEPLPDLPRIKDVFKGDK